jgi:hypothetical protein
MRLAQAVFIATIANDRDRLTWSEGAQSFPGEAIYWIVTGKSYLNLIITGKALGHYG